MPLKSLAFVARQMLLVGLGIAALFAIWLGALYLMEQGSVSGEIALLGDQPSRNGYLILANFGPLIALSPALYVFCLGWDLFHGNARSRTFTRIVIYLLVNLIVLHAVNLLWGRLNRAIPLSSLPREQFKGLVMLEYLSDGAIGALLAWWLAFYIPASVSSLGSSGVSAALRRRSTILTFCAINVIGYFIFHVADSVVTAYGREIMLAMRLPLNLDGWPLKQFVSNLVYNIVMPMLMFINVGIGIVLFRRANASESDALTAFS
jgi:hypothetical protein